MKTSSKKMKMTKHEINLLLYFRKMIVSFVLVFSSFNLQAQNNIFPESWDSTRSLRGKHGVVLAWIHVVDTVHHFDSKSCLLLKFYKDSVGDTAYYFTHQYFKNDSAGQWEYCYIHFGPGERDGIQYMGYRDLHIYDYPSKPTELQLQALFKQWMLSEHYLRPTEIVETGIDQDLWMKYLGFVPDKVF